MNILIWSNVVNVYIVYIAFDDKIKSSRRTSSLRDALFDP